VAKLLGAEVVLISQGGIGRCIDEICLNYALFEKEGVPVIGAIINKIFVDKYEKVSKAVRQGLKNNAIPCLGTIPYCAALTYPTIAQIQDEMDLAVFCGADHMANRAQNIIVGAMEPQNMMSYLRPDSLVIVPGDRVDNIIVSVNAHLMTREGAQAHIAGLLLTGGLKPHESVMGILREVDIPVLMSDEDTATAAYRARKFVAKITPGDSEKIGMAADLIKEHVDLDTIFGG